MSFHIVIDARIRRASTGRPVERLLEYLQDLDRETRYTILVQPDDPWQPRAGNFTALPCPHPQFSLNPLHEVSFARLLYRLRPDLVHFTMTQQPLLYFGTIVTMSHDTTMYYFVRRGSTPYVIYTLKMWLYKFLVWWSHRKSTKIVVPTQTVANEFIEMQPFIKDKIVVVHEATEAIMAEDPRRPAAVGEHDEFIMYLGTAFPHKNLETLIKAYEILWTQRPNLKLVFVGKREKHYDELAAKAAASPAASGIIITGFLPDEEITWLYAHARVFVFTSLSEGWGLPPLEAMANGAPVASSRASVMPEVYGDAAHYFDANDPGDVAAKVAEVMDNPKLRAHLIKNGYTQVKKYSWEKWAAGNLAVYRAVLAEKTAKNK